MPRWYKPCLRRAILATETLYTHSVPNGTTDAAICKGGRSSDRVFRQSDRVSQKKKSTTTILAFHNFLHASAFSRKARFNSSHAATRACGSACEVHHIY